jgi:hypothetical protein
MDHVSSGNSDFGFVWSAFTRGYHFNLYDKPFESPQSEGTSWRRVRRNVSQTLIHAQRMDLANVVPRGDLSSTGFCLAEPGVQYVVYQPDDEPFEVSGLKAGERYHFEWYATQQSRVKRDGDVAPAAARHPCTPSNKGMVLFLRRSRMVAH